MKDSSDYIKYKSFQEKLSKLYLCKSGGSMSGNINMTCNDITNVRNLAFCNNNYVMTFGEFSSNNQLVDLPSINSQPISLMRTTILYNPSINQTLPGGISQEIILDISNSIIENQLQLGISGDIISPSLAISGQYVEIYTNFEIQPSSNKIEFSLDISGVDCGFLEIIDSRYTERLNIYYLTFGPHMFIPSQWANCGQFKFKLRNHTNNAVTIRKFKIIFKSYYI
jgi:hypothetical protein